MANAVKCDTKKAATPGPKPDTLKIKGNWKNAARLFLMGFALSTYFGSVSRG
jgi:hypothetical protein